MRQTLWTTLQNWFRFFSFLTNISRFPSPGKSFDHHLTRFSSKRARRIVVFVPVDAGFFQSIQSDPNAQVSTNVSGNTLLGLTINVLQKQIDGVSFWSRQITNTQLHFEAAYGCQTSTKKLTRLSIISGIKDISNMLEGWSQILRDGQAKPSTIRGRESMLD